MKQNFQQQFNNLRDIIRTNVSTLKGLITQSEQLSNLIDTLTDKDMQPELKSQLEIARKQISQSISVLVEQTEKLFKSYNKLVEDVFGKQQ